MKIIISALVALSLLGSIAAPASAIDANQLFASSLERYSGGVSGGE